MNRSTWRRTASTTCGAALPTLVTAMPAAEVDPLAAVHVGQRAARRVVHIGRDHAADAAGDRGGAPLVEVLGCDVITASMLCMTCLIRV